MTTYNTGNPLGSADPRDLYDNAENIDEAVNSDGDTFQDRLAKSRLTWAGMENQFESDQSEREVQFDADQTSREQEFRTFIASSGYQFAGDYAAGIEITQYNQIIRDENGELWRVSGRVDLPYVTSGEGLPEADALVPAGDAVLRQDLANPNMGAAMVARGVVAVDSIADLLALPEGQRKEGLRYLVSGSVFKWDSTAGDWVAEGPISVKSFKAKGDGVIDDSLAIRDAILYCSNTDANTLYFPSGTYIVGSKVSVDLAGRTVHIKGEPMKSIIVSSVVGDTTLEIINAVRCTVSGIYLRGNNQTGEGGNGHAISFKDSAPGEGTIYPQGVEVSHVRVSGFRGFDVDVGGAQIESCGVFTSGKFAMMDMLLIGRCGNGIMMDSGGQTLIQRTTITNCDFWGMAFRSSQSSLVVSNCDIIACGFNSGILYPDQPGGAILFRACKDVLSVENVRVKDSATCVVSWYTLSLNILGCSLASGDTTIGAGPAVYAYNSEKVNIKDNNFFAYNTADPLTTRYEFVDIALANNIGMTNVTVSDNRFEQSCFIPYYVRLAGLGASQCAATIEGNIFGRSSTSASESTVESCIILSGLVSTGSIADNTIVAGETSSRKIINVLSTTPGAIPPSGFYIGRNRHRQYLSGVIENPLHPTQGSGSSKGTTSPAGALIFDLPPLFRTARSLVVTVRRSDEAVAIRANTGGSNRVFVTASRVSDGEPYAGLPLEVDWRADCIDLS